MIDASSERVEHHVERVEHPAERRGDERAARLGVPSRHQPNSAVTAAAPPTGGRSRCPRAASAGARARASAPCAPGVSPCMQMVSTRSGISRAVRGRDDAVPRPSARRAARPSSTSWMTAPGRVRGVSEPSGSYARSANPSARRGARRPRPRSISSRARQPEQDERRIERTDRARDRVGQRRDPAPPCCRARRAA